MRAFRILARYAALAAVRLLHFRINFLLILLYWFVSLSVLVVFWRVLFQFLPETLRGWSFPELCLLNSFCYVSWGIFVFFWGVVLIPEKVVSGEIDQYLSRPLSPLVGILGSEFRFEAVYEMMAGLIAIGCVVGAFGLPVDFFRGVLSFAALVAGTAVMVLIHATVALTSFWFGRIDAVQSLLNEVDDYQKYPTSFYPTSLARFVTFAVPLYFAGAFPAKIFLGKTVAPIDWMILAGLLAFWGAAFFALYRSCLIRYESVG